MSTLIYVPFRMEYSCSNETWAISKNSIIFKNIIIYYYNSTTILQLTLTKPTFKV